MISEINKGWNWNGFIAHKIILENEFGNVIFKTVNNNYWRICPEELSCEKIAENELELNQVLNDSEFMTDWNMTRLVQIAKRKLGELKEGEKYCLKIPAVISQNYEEENLAKISFKELILASGDLGYQIKDLKDGQNVEINLKSLNQRSNKDEKHKSYVSKRISHQYQIIRFEKLTKLPFKTNYLTWSLGFDVESDYTYKLTCTNKEGIEKNIFCLVITFLSLFISQVLYFKQENGKYEQIYF